MRVVDLFTIKPIDPTIEKQIKECNGLGLVIEEHYPEGGVFDAVCSAMAQVTDIKLF